MCIRMAFTTPQVGAKRERGEETGTFQLRFPGANVSLAGLALSK